MHINKLRNEFIEANNAADEEISVPSTTQLFIHFKL